MQGVEVEATMLVTEGFIVNANVSYNDGKYDKFDADTNGDGDIDQDFSGLPITRTPEWKWGLNPTYNQQALGGTITYGANLWYESEQTSYYYSGANHDYDSKLSAKTILDLNLTYTAPDNKWFARVYGNNVLDERYQIASQVVSGLWTHEQYWAAGQLRSPGGHELRLVNASTAQRRDGAGASRPRPFQEWRRVDAWSGAAWSSRRDGKRAVVFLLDEVEHERQLGHARR